MDNPVDNQFTWVIQNFSSSESRVVSSDHFVIGGCKWRLLGYPNGFNNSDYFSLFLEVADYRSLSPDWKIHARYLFTIVNQNSDKSSKRNEPSKWFDSKIPGWGASAMIPLAKLRHKNGGFLLNDELKIVAEVYVLEVVGQLNVSEESQPLKKIKLDNEILDDVNGFPVLPCQVDFVKRIFEKHPDIALEFRPSNIQLRKACMTFLLSLIETLCQSTQKLSNEDLVEADNALTYLKISGFKVEWLEKKLEKVKGKKKEEQAGETTIQELEKELNYMEALLEKERAKVFAARASLTFDDVI